MSKHFEYGVAKIAENTYLINEYYSSMFLLIGSERALVIDCGVGASDFKGLIERLTDKPYVVAATHAHVDHVGGRGQFERIFVSEKDAKYVKSSAPTALRRGYVLLYKLSKMASFDDVSIRPVKKEPEVEIISEGYEFDLGGRTVRVLETPGHTVGSVSYLDVENRTLYVGDVANENLLMFLPHATCIDELISTHGRILALDSYDVIWSSHHSAPQEREDVAVYREGARRILEGKKRNGLLPLVKMNDYEGAKLIYRTNRLYSKGGK